MEKQTESQAQDQAQDQTYKLQVLDKNIVNLMNFLQYFPVGKS